MKNETTKKRNTLKTQKKLMIGAAILAVLLCVLYFAVLRPMLEKHTYDEYTLIDGECVNIAGCEVLEVTGEGKVTYPDTGATVAYCQGGEATIKVENTNALATAGRYYMFPTIAADDVARIEIKNREEEYGFYYDNSTGETYIIGCAGTPYDQTAYSTLSAAARNPMSMRRLTTHADDLAKYGLDSSNDPIKYTITAKNGETHSVLVGDMIVTGGGYYCTTEGSRAVYIMDNSMGAFSLNAEDYVQPILSLPVSENDYFMTTQFTLTVDGKVLVSCGYLPEEERIATASTSTYKMFVPENYVPSTTNYGNILRKFISFVGTQTLEFGNVGGILPRETLEKYGLADPKYEIYYKYKGVDNYVYVSEQNDDGTYYAYSLLFNLVARVDADTLDFLNYEFIDFVDRPMFQKNINDVASIRIEANGVDETFTIDGDSQDTLTVTAKSTGKKFDEKTLRNFRLIYRKMLGLSIEEYAPEQNTDEWILRMTVVTDVGVEYKYDFYAYSTRRCFFTINDVGEFYCLRDRVQQIAADTKALMNGEDIDVTNLG